jgi:hypothetical protein
VSSWKRTFVTPVLGTQANTLPRPSCRRARDPSCGRTRLNSSAARRTRAARSLRAVHADGEVTARSGGGRRRGGETTGAVGVGTGQCGWPTERSEVGSTGGGTATARPASGRSRQRSGPPRRRGSRCATPGP